MRRFVLTVATAASLGMTGGPASADVRAGVEAYKRGDYAAALAEWRPLAERGDPDAQFNLAQAYRLGRGVPASMTTAIDLYKKAATQNHVEAGGLLGLTLFQNGKRAEAMPWLDKAARGGDAAAQYLYGTALFNGDLVTADPVRAYALMTQAAAQGFTPARSALAEMDKHTPLAARQQGTAMARAAASAPTAAAQPVRTASNAPTPRPSTPVTTRDDGPPSRPTRVAAVTARPTPVARPAPVAPRAAPAPAPATRMSGWKVQLGAFAQPASANALFASLKGRVGALSNAQPILVRAGAVTRLQAGPFASRAAATAACAAVKSATGQACFPVAP